MKFLVIFACLLAYSSAVDKEFIQAFMKRLEDIGKVCLPETGATQSDIDTIMKHEIPQSQEAKCMIFCFHRNLQMQKADGSIDKDGIMNLLEPLRLHDPDVYDKLVTLFNTCSASVPVNSEPCQYAADLAACGIKEAKAMGLHELILVE